MLLLIVLACYHGLSFKTLGVVACLLFQSLTVELSLSCLFWYPYWVGGLGVGGTWVYLEYTCFIFVSNHDKYPASSNYLGLSFKSDLWLVWLHLVLFCLF